MRTNNDHNDTDVEKYYEKLDDVGDAAMVTLMEINHKIEFLNEQLKNKEKLRKEQLKWEGKLQIEQLEKEEKLQTEQLEKEEKLCLEKT